MLHSQRILETAMRRGLSEKEQEIVQDAKDILAYAGCANYCTHTFKWKLYLRNAAGQKVVPFHEFPKEMGRDHPVMQRCMYGEVKPSCTEERLVI